MPAVPAPESPAPESPAPGDPALPALPAVRSGLAQVVVPATAVWFIGFLVLLFLVPTLREHDAMIWLWTFLSGWVLGLIGLSIYFWQRRAARRGSRGSSAMALDESIRSPRTG